MAGLKQKEQVMAIMKVIEIMGESGKSWEDATQNAVATAAKSVHGIKSVWVKDHGCKVKDGKIDEYRVTCKISFEVDS
jgi:flavin-binding protein dodecin